MIVDVNQTICDCGTDLEDQELEVFQIELDYLVEPVWMCIYCILGLDDW